jgi:predicted RNA-binding protein YlxR (DUF448 family)
VEDLMRVKRTANGGLDTAADLPGRGAWLCAGSPRCIDLADRRGAFGRALRGAIRQDAINALRALVAERERIEGRDHDESRRARED